MEKCKYCIQDNRGYHEDGCPITRIHEGYGAAQELWEKYEALKAKLNELAIVQIGEKARLNQKEAEAKRLRKLVAQIHMESLHSSLCSAGALANISVMIEAFREKEVKKE